MMRLRIKEAAGQRGINQRQLALKAQVTPQLLSRYWNNYTESAALIPLGKIARALNMLPGDLIEDTSIDILERER